MAITAQEAQNTPFEEGRRGYDSGEVEAFRNRVVEALRRYEHELAEQRRELEEVRARALELEEAEEAVKRTFLAATRAKNEMLAEAEAEAVTITEAATTEAAEVRSAAEHDAKQQRAAAARDADETRSRATAEAEELLAAARSRVEEADAHTAAERKRIQRRVTQVQSAVRDLEARLRAFAEGNVDEVAAIAGLIDLEQESAEGIEEFAAPAIDGD